MCSPSPCSWHQGDKWQKLLQIYDGIAETMFEESRVIATRFGKTQVHTSGNPNHPKLVFFHGISTNSLMFGDWLFPELSKQYFCIAIDTIGDLGRSCPRDGDPSNGPGNEQEMADWVMEVLDQCGTTQKTVEKVDMVGYSFGCFIASCAAKYYPDRVRKLVLLAPVGILAPVRKLWLAQAISFAVVSQFLPQDGRLAGGLRTWFFGSMMADTASMENLKYPELRKASDAVGGPQVKVQPTVWELETMEALTKEIPTLMIIGRQENVVDGKVAIKTAQKIRSGMQVKVYENAGHMFFCEEPKDRVAGDIAQFINMDVGR
ncbi:Alpha beta hydrolase fold [Seminavis robusta]|uniref:Alpha beta hydrolase fold n=1 Tax=Seminavis robusta TaxID=568900 RepID=A0A9N8HG98_9STRA|nr:Alpha beta hydrolase fold [Seminavis robusta]|eukprot:Sro472_g150030.1 Alpha beta hydrolase fold (318) ;mRNA; f:60463-61416